MVCTVHVLFLAEVGTLAQPQRENAIEHMVLSSIDRSDTYVYNVIAFLNMMKSVC